MKAFDVPISYLIAIIVVIVLITAVFLLLPREIATTNIGSTKAQTCSGWVDDNCDTDPSNIPVNGLDVNDLQELCEVYYGCSEGDTECCKQVCQC